MELHEMLEHNVVMVKMSMTFTQVQLPSASFRNSLDHSKWGVSMDESMPFVCIGDVNRQISQFKRGGGAACIRNKIFGKHFTLR
ncbi:deoxyribonuclease II [Parelaphostrongylus tenuis]|uniref:Deoxyribonuclease II n=1 Tax=Parelaphostrongylus tenuis TaxID=148309 RepID=A0AAD5QDD6_PARTN|nr:deoxyribonuclease II [Parelaphostrongylus tenuis]